MDKNGILKGRLTMKMSMERSAICLISFVLFLLGIMTAQAEETKHETGRVLCDISQEDIYNGISLVSIENTVYRLMTNGDVYAWEPEQAQYYLYANVPARPWFNVEIPFAEQSESIRDELTESVSQLIASDNGLYGFNDISGMIGLIDEEGWHVNHIRLDTSALMRSDFNTGYPQGIRNAYIENGILYAFHDIHLYHDGQPQSKLLTFNLSSGVCNATSLPNVISFCRYAAGKLLCIQDNGTEKPILAVYDIDSHQTTDIGVDVPVSISRPTFSQAIYLRRKIDGLAYDAIRDIIYFETPKRLWRSIAGAPFEPLIIHGMDIFSNVELMESGYMNAPDEAWVLSFGGYVSQSSFPYCVMP